MESRHKVILDVDTGVDDALAILCAVRSPRLDVIGITTCFGNVDVETATRNTLAVLEYAECQDIPVYVGSERPLLREWGGPVPWIHGDNGLGDADLPPLRRLAQDESATTFIHRMVTENPGEVTLIPVARMTNVAKVLQFDPSVADKVKRIVMMGGAAFCPGNVGPYAEANIWGDPEAAHIVFHSGAPITMVGLDVTMQARLTSRQLASLGESRYSKFLKDAVSFYINAYERTQAQEGEDSWCALHDPLAVAMVDDPTLCETREYHVDVETQGLHTAGMTVVDARAVPEHRPNASVCVGVDAPRFLQWCAERLGFEV